jgi:hypothetical protein
MELSDTQIQNEKIAVIRIYYLSVLVAPSLRVNGYKAIQMSRHCKERKAPDQTKHGNNERTNLKSAV